MADSFKPTQGNQEKAYHELCLYTLAQADPAFIHQHVFDAYAAQQADEHTKPVALTFALVGLYLHVEKQFSGKRVQQVHMALARHKQHWPAIALPTNRGHLSAIDVLAVPPGPQRDRAIESWCAAVWNAYHENRQAIADFLRERSIV